MICILQFIGAEFPDTVGFDIRGFGSGDYRTDRTGV